MASFDQNISHYCGTKVYFNQ